MKEFAHAEKCTLSRATGGYVLRDYGVDLSLTPQSLRGRQGLPVQTIGRGVIYELRRADEALPNFAPLSRSFG